MRIALDAMGSDDHPEPDVEGAVQAATEYGGTVVLVGDETQINAELAKHNITGLSFEVVHASQKITMEDSPTKVARSHSDSSMHVGMGLVESGDCDAFVSCGNTGAVLAIATLHKIRRIRGVHRPVLSTIIPFMGSPVILVDLGANVDCKPEWLTQFALMGSVYAERVLGQKNPRVALLSNGEEEGKGNALIHETIPLIAAMDLNYVGNVEPKEMAKGVADVIVADGFVGNLVAKTLEAMASTLFTAIREGVDRSLRAKIGALLMRPTFRQIYNDFDPAEIGGAPLLGINGVIIIGHGRSDARAVKNAIRQARKAVEGDIVETIRNGLKKTDSSA